MNPERLQEIIKPLEDLLERYKFIPDGEPVVEGAIRMAAFKKANGVKLDYALEVIKDDDEGLYKSDSELSLDVKLHKDGNAIELVDTVMRGNMPATLVVKYLVTEEIESNLKIHGIRYSGLVI